MLGTGVNCPRLMAKDRNYVRNHVGQLARNQRIPLFGFNKINKKKQNLLRDYLEEFAIDYTIIS
jgi:hypothetical protein